MNIKHHLTCILILCNLFIFCQQTTFELLLDTEDNQLLFDAFEDEYGYFYGIGYTAKPESEHRKGLLLKLDSNGNVLDNQTFTIQDSAYTLFNILQDTAGSLILTGFTSDTTIERLHSKLKMKRINYSLTTLVNKTYDISNIHRVGGFSNPSVGFNNDILITMGIFKDTSPPVSVYNIRLSNNLDSIYASKQYMGMYSSAIKQLSDSTYWIFGDPNGSYIICDTLFNYIQAYSTTHRVNEPMGIKWDTDTSFFMAGEWNGGPDDDIGIIRQYHPYDTTGMLFKSWGTLDTLDMTALTGAIDFQNIDSVYVGAITPFWLWWPTFPSNMVLLQTDSMLNIRWERFYGDGEFYYDLMKVLATKDGGCLLVGSKYDYYAGTKERDIYIIKVDNEGLLVSGGEAPGIEMHEALVFPNPGTNYLKIRVAAQHPKSVFELYDMKSSKVLTNNLSGKWSEINTSFLKPGTYIYKIYNQKGLNESGKWIKN